jgi:hypothetical protein
MSTIQERGDGCEICIDGRTSVIINGDVVGNKICDCKLPVVQEINFKIGQELKKNFDGRIVTVSRVGNDHIVLDGDFEPDHVVMKDKVLTYYKESLKINQ